MTTAATTVFRVVARTPDDMFVSAAYPSIAEATVGARKMWPAFSDRGVTAVVVVDGAGEETVLWRAPTKASELRQGHYAVNGKRYFIDRPTSGSWAGWTFLKTGSDYHNRRTIASVRPDGSITRKHSVLTAIMEDPFARAAEYGQITGECAACGRKLEDPESISIGMGPICREKWGI